MASRSDGIPALERVEAILRNPALYRLAEAIPRHDPPQGGRPRLYPAFMWLVFEALISVYRSARATEAELAHPIVWARLRSLVRERFSDNPAMWLPEQPMRRHHYRYGRDRYLTDPAVLEELATIHRETNADLARQLGLLDADGPGSWTHPDPSRLLYADGKVIAPLYRAKPDEEVVDPNTGELRARRHERDADLHFEGDGEAAWGTKFVLVATRSDSPHGRVILDCAWVPKPGAEAATAMACLRRLAPLVPGAHGVVYDTALRGVHHQDLLRHLGLMLINRVTAAKGATKKPRRRGGRRVEKTLHLEDKVIRLADGTDEVINIYARGGAIGIAELTDTGALSFHELRRVRTHRIRDKSGAFRWYNDCALPERLGPRTLTVRLHGTEHDAARKVNRPENVRVIPPSDPDFARLFRRRNDAESINRAIDDTLYLGRAHSLGHARQHLNVLGFALMVNSLALAHHQRAPTAQAA
jgi:hypothetical protein